MRTSRRNAIDIREPVFVEVDYWNLSDDPQFRPSANFHFFNAEGTYLFITKRPEQRDLASGVVCG
jgi:hypothetical protein